MKYLDKTGLTYLWSKIKSKIPTKTSQLTNDSNYITSSGSTSGNAGSATKLQTARTIGIGTGATGTATSFNGTANITIPITDVKDAYVTWGGKAMTTLSPNDMGCVDEFGHNKLAFLPASKISVEYTTDGGTTWLDYGLTDAQKVALVTTNGPACRIGKGTVSAKNGTMTNENCANYKVRVTLTGVGSLYTICKKILLNMSTDGASGCKLKIEARTYTDYNAGNDTWRDIATYDVAGWSGWNSLPVSTTYGGANSWSDAQLRFTLSITSVNTAYTCQAQLIDFRMIGINNWSTPSELARAGHIYKIDTDQSALFPANITPQVNNSKTLGTSSLKWNNVYATTFTGNLSGNATTATSATSSDKSNSTYILDTRSVNSTPNDYMGGGRRVVYEFKNISAINSPFSSGTYCTLKTICQWDNTSGGLPVQVAYNYLGDSPKIRVATSGTAWGEWKEIALTSDIPDISGKQDTLTFDSEPTNNSTNPVTSGGLFTTFKDYLKHSTYDTTNHVYKATHNATLVALPMVDTSTNKLYMGNLPYATSITNDSTTIPKTSAVYSALSSKADTSDIPTKVSDLTNDAGYTTNTGTITGIKMNGASKGTSGVVDLGTVITAHQDISGKQDKITSTNKLDYSLLSNTPTIPSAVTESTVSGWGFTKNAGTITKVQANGTDIASSGTANIPSATTSRYGVTKLSNATDSTSEVLAATPKAVKSAYDTATAAASVASNASASAQNAYDLASVASSASAEALSDIGDMSGLIGGSDIVGAIDTLNTAVNNRLIKPDVLYENASGSQGANIALSKNWSNYDVIAIVYTRGKVQYIDTNFYNNAYIDLSYFWNDGTSGAGVFGSFYKLSTDGTQLQYQYSRRFYFYTWDAKPTIDTTNNVGVHKVLGYKY